MKSLIWIQLSEIFLSLGFNKIFHCIIWLILNMDNDNFTIQSTKIIPILIIFNLHGLKSQKENLSSWFYFENALLSFLEDTMLQILHTYNVWRLYILIFFFVHRHTDEFNAAEILLGNVIYLANVIVCSGAAEFE